MKTRSSVPVRVKRLLLLEAGYKCAMLRCEHETGLEVHHIDENPSNNDPANLMVLCAVHHARVTSGEIDAATCRTLKSLLSVGDRHSRAHELHSKTEVNAALCREIEHTTSFRAILAGPYFLNPDWVFEQRRRNLHHEDFDLKLAQFLFAGKAPDEARIICTNSPRYLEKMASLVAPEDRDRLAADLLRSSETLWASAHKGPGLCCIHPGFSHIAYIFDDAVITQFRAQQTGPSRGGYISRSAADIQRETSRFDTIFETASEGQQAELAKLRKFLGELPRAGIR